MKYLLSIIFLIICLSFDCIAALNIKVGTYTGNGTDDRAITGVGFQPTFVLISAASQTQSAVLRIASMTGDTSAFWQGYTPAADLIQSLDADGFTIGTDAHVNSNTKTFYYYAFGGTATNINTGSYTGDGVDDRSITGVGFQPDFVLVRARVGSATQNVALRTSTMTGDVCWHEETGGTIADSIQALEADGFQIGLHFSVNKNAVVHDWVAIKVSSDMKVGSYTGNATDDRSITGVGFQTGLVWILGASATTRAVSRPSLLTGDNTLVMRDEALLVNAIQALQADGFQVGTEARVNANTVVYYYVAWKGEAAAAAVAKGFFMFF